MQSRADQSIRAYSASSSAHVRLGLVVYPFEPRRNCFLTQHIFIQYLIFPLAPALPNVSVCDVSKGSTRNPQADGCGFAAEDSTETKIRSLGEALHERYDILIILLSSSLACLPLMLLTFSALFRQSRPYISPTQASVSSTRSFMHKVSDQWERKSSGKALMNEEIDWESRLAKGQAQMWFWKHTRLAAMGIEHVGLHIFHSWPSIDRII
jgi:hypothetical protein